MTNDEWHPPNQPNVKRDFNEAAQNSQPADHSDTDAAAQQELEALKKAREKPILGLHLTPGGSLEEEAHKQVAKAREERIKELEERLNKGLENDRSR